MPPFLLSHDLFESVFRIDLSLDLVQMYVPKQYRIFFFLGGEHLARLYVDHGKQSGGAGV